MCVFNERLGYLLECVLKIAFILFIVCMVIPSLVLHGFKTLKEVPTEPWPIGVSALIGGIVGAAFRDGVNMLKDKLISKLKAREE